MVVGKRTHKHDDPGQGTSIQMRKICILYDKFLTVNHLFLIWETADQFGAAHVFVRHVAAHLLR